MQLTRILHPVFGWIDPKPRRTHKRCPKCGGFLCYDGRLYGNLEFVCVVCGERLWVAA